MTQHVYDQKKNLRLQIKKAKAQYTQQQLLEMSHPIIQQLEAHPLFRQAKTLLLYSSLPDEVDTQSLINKLRTVPTGSCTKQILLPSVAGEVLELHTYNAETSLTTGAFGIQESNGLPFHDYAGIDLAVLPGIAFDSEGRRLGRGKGYYDRLLTQLNCPTIGLCFPFQFLENIPAEPWDRSVTMVIHSSISAIFA